jgi:addiction module RelB/DinJ family antitoxin
MTLVTRSAILQARICPEIKYASEQVLHRIGLNMTEALELFLRRVIVDEKLPFEIVALNDARLSEIAEEYERQLKAMRKIDGKQGAAKKRI